MTTFDGGPSTNDLEDPGTHPGLKPSNVRREDVAAARQAEGAIGYIRTDIPAARVPPYRGERYTTFVPDTLDLQERAILTINALTSPTDPAADYEIYWVAFLNHRPPMMQHDWNDHVQVKFISALPLLRIMSGSEQNAQVEQRWMEVVLHMVGPDGLIHTPLRGRPWGTWCRPDVDTLPQEDQIVNPFDNGRLLEAIVLYAMRDGGEMWRSVARGVVDGLNSLAVGDGRKGWFWPSVYRAERGEPNVTVPAEGGNCELRTVPLGLVYAYRLLGYEPALLLAGRLATYLREEYFLPDGTFLHNQRLRTRRRVHFHCHTASLLAMLEYAHETGDADLLEFVCSSYRYAKSQGETLTGFFPEMLHSVEEENSELCEVADMIALALKLSEYRVLDCWDDAERWLRNMFAEGQLTRLDWIESLTAGQPESVIDPSYQSVDSVAARNLGAFAGYPTMNDWYPSQLQTHMPGAPAGALCPVPGIVHCCTGNAARTLYQAWETDPRA